MKNIIILGIAVLLKLKLYSQADTACHSGFAEMNAEYPGGSENLLKFFKKELIYPEGTDCSKTRITLCFTVDTLGKARHMKAPAPSENCVELENELKRIIDKMPLWKPAETNGKKVNACFRIPIHIKPY